MGASHLTDKERKSAIRYLKAGKSQNWTAQKLNRSPSTINEVAKAAGLTNIRAPKNANRARRDYAKAERIALLNRGFDKAEDLLETLEEAKALQAWMVAMATGIDKRRLEDGEVTDRSERHSHAHTGDLEEYFAQLDAFADENREDSPAERLDTPEANGKTTRVP